MTEPTARKNARSAKEAAMATRVLNFLSNPHTYADVAEELRCSYKTAQKYVQALYDEGMVSIVSEHLDQYPGQAIIWQASSTVDRSKFLVLYQGHLLPVGDLVAAGFESKNKVWVELIEGVAWLWRRSQCAAGLRYPNEAGVATTLQVKAKLLKKKELLEQQASAYLQILALPIWSDGWQPGVHWDTPKGREFAEVWKKLAFDEGWYTEEWQDRLLELARSMDESVVGE